MLEGLAEPSFKILSVFYYYKCVVLVYAHICWLSVYSPMASAIQLLEQGSSAYFGIL